MLWSANRGWGKEKENGNLSMGCVGCSVGSVKDVFVVEELGFGVCYEVYMYMLYVMYAYVVYV